jgi:uroporphyrinogen decarboxylase
MLTSYERVMNVFQGKVPDRVPIWELSINSKVRKLLGKDSLSQFVVDFDLDAVSLEQPLAATNVDIEWVDKEDRLFKDQWGILYKFTLEDNPYALEGPIKTKEDLRRFKLPDPSRTIRATNLTGIIKTFKREKAIFFPGREGFLTACQLRGTENLLMDFILDPSFAKSIIDLCNEYYIELNRLSLDAGVDLIVLVDDYAYKSGPLMSPEHFRRFILPSLCRSVEDIKKRGGYVVKHTDGNIWSLIEMIVDSGIDCLGPLEPGAGMDLQKVKKIYGHRISVMGNIDVDLLCRGSKDNVIMETKKCIARVSPGGGHFLSSANSITSAVNTENYLAMISTGKAYGKYPIQVQV